jgi:hypothetical protein
MDSTRKGRCDRTESMFEHALQLCSASEAAELASHLSECAECRAEVEALRPIVASFVTWPTDVLRPSASLRPFCRRRNIGSSRNGTTLRLASLADSLRQTARTSGSACSYDLHQELRIRLIAMQEWKSCICFMASSRLMAGDSIPATITEPSRAAPINASTAKPVARACSSRRRRTGLIRRS